MRKRKILLLKLYNYHSPIILHLLFQFILISTSQVIFLSNPLDIITFRQSNIPAVSNKIHSHKDIKKQTLLRKCFKESARNRNGRYGI